MNIAIGFTSPMTVIRIMATFWRDGQYQQEKVTIMPVLMIALIALGAFVGIGILLGSAVVLEHRSRRKA